MFQTSIATGTASTQGNLVVFVHGLAATRIVFRPMAARLRQAGFQTLNWGYPSIRGEIRSLSQSLAGVLREIDERSSAAQFHLVTHSMGSILARAVLADASFRRLGRVVMLGPPHHGSCVARQLSRYLNWLCPPLRQLSDHPDSLVNSLPHPVGVPIGIIAAARDRVVHLASTRLDTQADHIVVNSHHTAMLFRTDVAVLVERFLREGAFHASPNTLPLSVDAC